MAGIAFSAMARTVFDRTTLAVFVAVYLWMFLVFGCVVGQIYPSKVTRESLERSHILRSWLCMNLEIALSLMRFGKVVAPKIRLQRYSDKLQFWELQMLRYSQLLALRTTEEIQESLKPFAQISVEVELVAPTPVRKQIELLRAKADVTHFRRLSIDFEMRLEEAKEQHKKLETTIARRIEVIGKLHADHADEKARLFKEMDELRAKVAQEKRQSEHEIKELRKLTTDLRSGHGRAIAAERERAADSLAESQERYDELAIELSDAQKVNDGFSATIQTLEKQKKELSVKLSDSKAAVLREKKTVVQVRQKCSLLETQLSAAQQKHKQTSHYLIVVLVFLWRFSRYLGGRLATSLRSRNTLLVQWKVLSQQKIQSRRALIRSLNMNQTLHTQLMAQGIARIEAERLANTWKQRLVESVERREKASSKFLACIQRTKGRFNETTRRLLTGVLFLWRLNLLLSQRLATTGRMLRAIEDAPELADIVSLARIEEVSEPSGSKCSIASLAEAISENSLTSASSGLGLSLDSVPRLTSEASIQTTDETDIPSTLSVKGEHLIFQSCGVDTADLEPTAVDVGVMTEPSPEEALLGERIACLNKKFDSMETIDSIYLRLFVKPQQAVHPLPSASPASPTLNRIPFPGRIGVPIIPSAVRQPFIPQPSVLANRLVQKGNGRIFSEALDRVPFPQHAYMRQDAGPSTPGLVPQAGSPQIPGTPTPASMRGHRHPFLLNNTPGNLSFN